MQITPAKEIKGSFLLPSSPDMLFVSLCLSISSGCRTQIEPVRTTPDILRWAGQFKNLAKVVFDASSCIVEPLQGNNQPPCFAYTDIPYRDFTVFLLLAHTKSIVVSDLPPKRLEQLQQCCLRAGCAIAAEQSDGMQKLVLEKTDHFHIPDTIIDADDIHPFLGLAIGLRQPVEFIADHAWSSPLKHALQYFGYTCTVKSLSQKKDEDPIMRRIRFMKTGKKSEGPQQFSVSLNFIKAPEEQVHIDLPGDELLAGLIIAAKCLIPKGSFVLENVGLESWNTQILQLVKSMGGAVGVQESRMSSFGSVGSVVIQKINPFGRKVDCRPRCQYVAQLPAMIVMAAFAQGQSIFRNLEDRRNDDPDGLEQLNLCIAALGARQGEMPDGIVIEGAKQFDGFDLSGQFSADIAGAFAIAGLKCRGITTIADESILNRCPDFTDILSSICDFKE